MKEFVPGSLSCQAILLALLCYVFPFEVKGMVVNVFVGT